MATHTRPARSTGVLVKALDWNPAKLLQPLHASHNIGEGQSGDLPSRFALIILNQPLADNFDLLRVLWDHACLRVAADGGANRLYEIAGKHGDSSFDELDVIIGDLDSLTDDTRRYYETRPVPSGSTPTQIIRNPDQESTDFGKAVYHIRSWHREQQQKSQGNNDGTPLDIVAIGGLGGRVDQALSQIHHLYLFQAGGVEEDDEEGQVPAEQRSTYDAGRVYLVSSHSLTFLLRRGRHRIRVREVGEAEAGIPSVFGKHVGILPIGEPSRITTRGLEWDVTDWLTRFGGRVSTSNHILPETEVVEVETTRDVVWTMALNRVEVG